MDISTPPAVFEAVEAVAVAHFKANPSDFSGEKMIIANLVGDPLKYMLCVWWEYAYPGKCIVCTHPLSCLLCMVATSFCFVAVLCMSSPANAICLFTLVTAGFHSGKHTQLVADASCAACS